MGPCLELLLKHNVLLKLVQLTADEEGRSARAELVLWLGVALLDLERDFLVHSSVHQALGPFRST